MICLVLLLLIPLQIRTQSRYHAPDLEALCIFLRRLAYPNRLCELELLFNRGSSALSEIANFVSGYINEHFSHFAKFKCSTMVE
ncbi:hypothetical protein FQR65_LT19894 [Abscondita terminalis]|nr:hypothetical protein FQR65_LT19894 [Abscondita terminalis]